MFARDGGMSRIAFDGFDQTSRTGAVREPQSAVTETTADFDNAPSAMGSGKRAKQRAV